MRLCVFFIVVLQFAAFARGNAQHQIVTLNMKNVSYFELFNEIHRQTGLRFIYNTNQFEGMAKIDVFAQGEEVGKVLESLFAGTPFAVTFSQNVVMVTKKAAPDDEKKSVTVRGFVYDEKKQPMPGVTVQVVGTSVGTATTERGWFSIDLPMLKGKLKFSFVGYKDKEVAFTDQIANDTLRVYMEESVEELDEAVVVAYGETTRRKATGAISVVKSDELQGIPSTNIASLLQGRVAGLDITNITGAPGGGGMAVTIRGYNSLDVDQERRQFSNPLWVVDGVPLNSFTSPVTGTNLLAEINPDMIESVQVLKDASAASIYGSRAANGVIIITTKKGGANQKATFSVNFSQTWSVLPKLPTIMIGRKERILRLKALRNMPQAYLDWENKQYKYPTSLLEVERNPQASMDWFYPTKDSEPADGIVLQDSLNAFYNNATNFFPMYFETGKVTNANIQTYGGTDKMTYGIGLGYYDEAGILKGTGFNRIDLTTNISVTPIERLDVDLRFYISLTNRKKSSENQTDGFQTSTNVEVVPGDQYELTT